MENSNPVILEISSDDDTSFGEAIVSGGGGGVGEDHNWLSELLHEVDKGRDDSDDVVLVDEVVVKPKRARLNSSNSSAKTANYDGDDEDDECVILENDPDKQLTVSNNSEVDEEDSDDLVVVCEKGQVACRDFPHPRHLCVTYPFASTPHGTHCKQCHCYVCDSRAPCLHWGLGISSIDHCHATDKEEFWKTQRKNMKEGDKNQEILDVVPPARLPPHQPNSSAQQQILSVVPPVRLPTPQPNSLAQNRDFNQVTACPKPPISFPNITNQGRRQPSVPAVPRYRCQPHSIAKQLPSTNQQSVFSTKRRQKGGTSGPQFMTPCTAVRNSGPARVDSVNNRPGYGLSRNSNASQLTNNTPLPRWQPQLSSQTRTVTNPITYRPQVSSQPYQSNNFQATVLPRPQIAPRPIVRNHSESTSTPHRPSVTRAVGGNSFSLPPPPPLYASSTFELPLLPTSTLSNTNSTYGYEQCVSPQYQVYTTPTDVQNIFQQESQIQNGFGTDNIGVSNQQISAGSSQLQNPVPADKYQNQSVATEDISHSQGVQPENVNSNSAVAAPTPAPADNFSFTDSINSGFSHDPLDFGFESFDGWFENQSVPGAFEVFSVYSPEPGTIDSGTLFDFGQA